MLEQRYKQVQENIQEACKKASREIDSVELLAVSKFHDAQSIAKLAQLGHRHFAESYFKEYKEKKPEVEQLLTSEIFQSLQWHSIGHIQTNKAKDACSGFEYLHTVDSFRLVDALEKVLAQKLQKQNILIEVNIGEEEQKAGVMPKELENLIEKVLMSKHMSLQGFMCLPPFQKVAGENRKYFSALYELKTSMEAKFSASFPHLSMGTSSDYVEAIMEGASFVRIGTDIFGERIY